MVFMGWFLRRARLLAFDYWGTGYLGNCALVRFCWARSGTWRAQLRGCPPACGLLLDAAALCTPSARAAYLFGWGAVVDCPLPHMPSDGLHRRSGWCTTVDRPLLRESWSAVYSAQRHQGGGGGHKPPRGTAAELSTPSACSCTRQSKAYSASTRDCESSSTKRH
jgi:hypothetical protein